MPSELRTLVVVPALLTRTRGVRELIERIEVHYLSNQGATSPTPPQRLARFRHRRGRWRRGAARPRQGRDQPAQPALRTRAGGERFLLLHRRRQWNASQQKWMGWERKRGKLEELNRLLRGARDTSFIATDGQAPAAPRDVRYVVTLDSDTRMPRETIRRLVGKMAMPSTGLASIRASGASSRATASCSRGSTAGTSGRLGRLVVPAPVRVLGRHRSLCGRDLGRLSGPLRGGHLPGKGIYDVDAFSAALEVVRPRTAFSATTSSRASSPAPASPATSNSSRSFPSATTSSWRACTAGCAAIGNCCRGSSGIRANGPERAALGRWKMFDNLRRSLSPLAIALGLLAGFALPPPATLPWTLFLLAALIVPSVLRRFPASSPSRRGARYGNTSAASGGSSGSRSFKPACSSRSSPIRRS